MKHTYKLGLHIEHNASCTLMRDGEIIYVGQEERFCRKKNIMGFPMQALKYGLEKEGIGGADIDEVAYGTINAEPLLVKSNQVTNFSIRDYYDYYGPKFYGKKLKGENCDGYFEWLRDDPQFNKDKHYFDLSFLDDKDTLLDGEKCWLLFREELVRILGDEFSITPDKITFNDHHTSHAYYGYFASPFRAKDCAIIVLDGWGDGCNQSTWKAENDVITELARSPGNDIGRVYKMATLILGMRPDEHEYKVMGMAPYAKGSYVDQAYEALKPLSKIKDMKVVSDQRPADLFAYLQDQWLDKRFDNIGGAVQRFSEEIASDLLRDVHEKTGMRRFVISGGIAMNVKMNQVLSELDFVDEIFVPGSPADESLSIGACYYLNRDNKGGAPLSNMYLGYDIESEKDSIDWSAVGEEFDVKKNATVEDVAEILARGDVVSRVNGASEFGARALGHRSILANPSHPEAVYNINEAIKQRDFWMPFALSILEDHVDEYIHNPKNLSAPFMTVAFHTKGEHYERIKAGTHPYDKTVRPQFVSKEHTPDYYDLIEAFRQKVGVPALLNTSFNMHGEPIVNTLDDALRTMRNSGLNYLYYGDVLVSKRI